MPKRVIFHSKSLEDVYVQKFYAVDFQIIKDNGYELILTDKFSDLFKWWKYDILFSYFYTWTSYKALIARCLGKKVYVTGGIDSLDRHSETRKRFLIQKFFFFICYYLSTKCIIVSDNDYNNIIKEYGGHLKKKLVKSYHVVDINKFFSDNQNRTQSFTTICWQGNPINIQRKGIDKALRLFAYLKQKEEFKEFEFNIIGKKGEATEIISNMIMDLGLENSVHILGEVDEDTKISYLKESKYYFQLSTYEGFGLAALEALTAGNIVIHSNKGGLKYVIGDSGVIVNSNSELDSFCSVYKDLLTFDYSSVVSGQNRVKNSYNYKKRLKDFKNIFGNGGI